MSWHRERPAEFEQVREEMRVRFPDLHAAVRNDLVWFEGPFRIADASGVELTRYQIAIRLPADFPECEPDLFETQGRVLPTPEHHAYRGGHACLWAPGERWMHWPRGAPLSAFVDGAVRSYLVGHAYFEATGEWLEARKHDAAGVVEAYEEMLTVSGQPVVLEFIRLMMQSQPRQRRICPCGGGSRLHRCHGPEVMRLRELISDRELRQALRFITQPAPARRN